MIILFEENETDFSSLGLGVLKDVISCKVSETLNDSYELELVYPIDGNNFSKIEINRIIYCKSSPYSNSQPFRIYNISKPINGKITVDAAHISYDMNGIAVNSINGYNLNDTLEKIQNGTLTKSNFKFYADMSSNVAFKTTAPYNMRAILMGSEGSLIEKYKCEVKFDRFEVHLTQQRGSNRGVQVRYAKNMTSLKHDINYDNLYNGVYPYYHSETTQVSTVSNEDGFKQVYIVGKKPYQDGWLSYTNGGEPYHPVDTSPVQIATEGDYYQKVYAWNSTIQRYEEKIYNETLTLIEGVVQPDWIYIDWTKFPSVVCKAGVNGYFKTSSDTNWTYHNKDDVIFEGSILKVDQLAGNIILYYSEVIPTASSSSSNEETSVTHIELKDKIMWLDTPEAKAMKHDRILMLDLTSEFSSNSTADGEDNTPTEEKLEAKAKEYIEKNKIGKLKFNTDLSFVDLSTVVENNTNIDESNATYLHFLDTTASIGSPKKKNTEKIELGDTVEVVYNELGIDINLRVITTEYDPILDQYTKITLGEKSEKISASSVQTGDDVSSLTNDVGYTDISTVNKLIAKIVTADYIQAQNAKLSTAQILELETARIKCTGILEATQLELDKLVAKLLIADNAEIAQQLSAGTIKVAGDITVNSGSISITNGEKVFSVTREGDLTANSVNITGGTLRIADSFEVSNDGLLSATGADIQGTIKSVNGEIGGFTITDRSLYNTISSFTEEAYNGVYIGTDGIKLGTNFSVDDTGKLIAKSGEIGGATIENGVLKVGEANVKSININNRFTVDEDGTTTIQNGKDGDEYAGIKMNAENGTLTMTGTISATTGKIGGFTITNKSLYNGTVTDFNEKYTETVEGVFLGTDGIRIGPNLTITKDGVLKAGDEKEIPGQVHTNTGINEKGQLTANSAVISGKITALEGYIGNPNENGFNISSKAISYGYSVVSPDVHDNAKDNVVYLGSDAIRLGPDPNKTVSLPQTGSWAINSAAANIYIEIPEANSKPQKSWNGRRFRFTFDSSSNERWLCIGFGKYNKSLGEVVIPQEAFGIYPAVTDLDTAKSIYAKGYLNTPGDYIVSAYQYFKVPARADHLDILLKYPLDGEVRTKLIFNDNNEVVELKQAAVDGDLNIDRLYIFATPKVGDASTYTSIRLEDIPSEGFYVNQNGNLIATNATINGSFQGNVNIFGGSISISKDDGSTSFKVDGNGNLTANSGHIAGFSINKDGMYDGDYTNPKSTNYVLFSKGYRTNNDIANSTYISSYTQNWILLAGQNFGITYGGQVYANKIFLGKLWLSNTIQKTGSVLQSFRDFSSTNATPASRVNTLSINVNTWKYTQNDPDKYMPKSNSVSIWGETALFDNLCLYNTPGSINAYFSNFSKNGFVSSIVSKKSRTYIGRIPQSKYHLIPFFLSDINGMTTHQATINPDTNEEYGSEATMDLMPKVHNPIFVITEHSVEGGKSLKVTAPSDPTSKLALNRLVYANVIGSDEDYVRDEILRTYFDSKDGLTCYIYSEYGQRKVYLFRIFI